MIYSDITELIGNTPMLKINPAVHGLKNIDLYAKLESWNPFGSVKDRIAWGMIKDDLASIRAEGKQILESSSGNTAKALQALASINGIPFKTITNRIKVSEVRDILLLMGADIEELPGKSDCHDPNDPNDPLVFIQKEIHDNPNGTYFTSQYSNERNLQTHYETTGEEIRQDLGRVDYFIAGVGTTGSSRGAALKLKETNPDLITVGVVANKRDYIPGIRNGDEVWEVGLFEPDFYHALEYVDSTEAVDGAIELIRKSGILAGPTSGASYRAALKYLRPIDEKLTEKKSAVFIVCDRVEWYISYIKARRPEIFGLAGSAQPKCVLTDEQIDAVPTVSIDQAHEWIQSHKPMIVDIRTLFSFRMSHIEGSINIPDVHLEALLADARPFCESQKLLFLCPMGKRSRIFAADARLHGYDAYNLEGGLRAWKEAGLPLVTHTHS